MIRSAVLALVLAVGACSPGSGGAAPVSTEASPALHPVSGLEVTTLRIRHGSAVHRFRVELALTGAQQARGLMFRTVMGADEGMLFPMNPPRPASFWMRNTVLPLDIVFVGTDGRILNIAANAVPYDESRLFSLGPVSAVLELNGGRAAQLGIGPGDPVEW